MMVVVVGKKTTEIDRLLWRVTWPESKRKGRKDGRTGQSRLSTNTHTHSRESSSFEVFFSIRYF